jgi:hypothetical protein
MKINGSLVFDASSASEIQNLRVEKVASLPTHQGAADAGRIIYLTTDGYLYKGNASAWVALATGGSAFSQTEGDAIEVSLGAGINTDGTFHAAGFPTQPGLTSPSSFTDAINQLAAYATSKNQLFELDDVALSSATPSAGKFLMFNGTSAVDHTLILADVTDVTATAAEVNQLHLSTVTAADLTKLHNITTTAAQINNATATTATTTELNFVSGVTSAIQTQLDGKQPIDATLTALAGIDALTGILVETGANVFTARTLVAPAAGITITDPAGIAGNPTFALANDLAALEGLTTSGYIVRTGDGTATTRSIVGTTSNIVVTNGSGVTSDTSVDLAAVTQAATGNFVKVTLDGFGRVTGNTAVTTADITGLVDATYVNVTGDTMTGNLVMGAGTVITLTDTATAATDAVNKAYVDAMAQGLSWKGAVKAASTAPLTLASGFAAGQIIDGVTLVVGDRILVKNQTAAAENGIYVVTAGAPTRALDMDIAAEFQGAAVLVQQGTTQADYGYVETAAVTTVGTSAVTFNQFTGASVLTPGVGLYQTANVLNVALGAGIAELPTAEVGIDLYNAAGGNLALILTTDGTTHSTATGAKLHLLLDTGSGLTQTATGLKINAASVTNAMLTNPSITLNSDTGTSTLALGGTLQVIGTSTQGISTANAANVVTITASDASASQKGVATFNTASFTATAGDITIKAAGVTNTQLVNSTIGFSGTTGGAQTVALGAAITVLGGTSPITTVSSGAGLVINVADATTTTLGLASFNSTMFSVTAGAVSIASTLGTVGLTNVNATVDTATANDMLTYAAGKWVNATRAAVLATQSINDLGDVTTTTPAAGEVLSYTAGGQWINKKIYHVETVSVAATTWTVAHALGAKFCNVTVVDSTDNVVIPQSIVFDSTSQLTVTFNTAITGSVVVMAVA